MSKSSSSAGGFRFLTLFRPLVNFVPEVAAPITKVTFQDKLLWTVGTLFIFLVCCQIPLYGIAHTQSKDPFYWMRVILASNRGSLMELGISPIITSGTIMTVLSGAKLIDYDPKIAEDKQLFNCAQKLFGILITIASAISIVASGSYGTLESLGAGNAILIIFQLFAAGMIILLLDEMLTKGYGLGSGISLFIATNICESIIWKSFSPITTSGSNEGFEGAILAAIYLLFTKTNKLAALEEAFYREGQANLSNLLGTVVVFLIVVQFQGWKVNIPIKNSQEPFAIKLFYTSNMPVIIQTSITSSLLFFSKILFERYPGNFLIKLLGEWKTDTYQQLPKSGLVYYISHRNNIKEDPLQFFVYCLFMLTSCAVFARFWIELSGQSFGNIKKQLQSSGAEMEPKNIELLKKYIPVAAGFGGICIGLLSILADCMGAIGSGTGILLAVTIIYQYYEVLKKGEKGEGFVE
jgi:protein transport protein SEC61 subunit alpha